MSFAAFWFAGRPVAAQIGHDHRELFSKPRHHLVPRQVHFRGNHAAAAAAGRSLR